MFPKISTKTDSKGHSIAYPDVCKTPAPPAPFTPIPYPSVHAKMLAGAKKVVLQAVGELEKGESSSSISASSGDEAGTLKAVTSLKNIEKLIHNHEVELKKAPKTEYKQAVKIQQQFEKEVEKEVKQLDKALKADKKGQKVAKEIVKVVGKAARAN
jgi:hypothetical protein